MPRGHPAASPAAASTIRIFEPAKRLRRRESGQTFAGGWFLRPAFVAKIRIGMAALIVTR